MQNTQEKVELQKMKVNDMIIRKVGADRLGNKLYTKKEWRPYAQ